MTITYNTGNQDQIVHMLNDQMTKIDGCVNLSIVKICYDVILPNINVTVSILGVDITSFKLDPMDTCQTVNIDVGVASGSLTLCFKERCLTLSGEVSMLFAGTTHFDNVKIVCL